MDDDLRVAIIGYGIGGRRFHAPLVTATDGLRLDAIVTSDPQRVAQAGSEYPQAAVLASSEELFARAGDLDLVVVTTPNRTHVPLAMRAIELGVPVVVDKPLAPSAADAERLRDAAASRGVLLTVFQNRRWDSDFLTVQKVLRSGVLGSVFRFESRYDRWRPTVAENWRELGDPEEAGGLLFDLGAHTIDQALRLFGPVAQVYAELDRRRAGARVDDDVFVALHHTSGVRTHLWCSVLAGSLNPRFRLLGDAASFTKFGLDPQESQTLEGLRPGDADWGREPETDAGFVGRGDGEVESVPTEVGRYEDFYAEVRDALRGTGDLPVDAAEAVEVLRVIEASRRSAAEGAVISLDASTPQQET